MCESEVKLAFVHPKKHLQTSRIQEKVRSITAATGVWDE